MYLLGRTWASHSAEVLPAKGRHARLLSTLSHESSRLSCLPRILFIVAHETRRTVSRVKQPPPPPLNRHRPLFFRIPCNVQHPSPPPSNPNPDLLFARGFWRQVVHEYTPLSGPHYVLAQLLQWHNHGEGGNPNEPFDDKLRG